MKQNNMMINPYIIGRPINETEVLFGREDIFDFINDQLTASEKFIFLSGQRRIGKSSVLFHVYKHLDNNIYTIVDFDLQDKADLPLDDVLYKLANKIIDSLELESVNYLPAFEEFKAEPRNLFDIFLTKIYQELGDKKIVLLLDEFDALIPQQPNSQVHSFVKYLQDIAKQRRHNKLFCILVVMRKLEDMQNILPLLRKSPNREIGLLDEKSAKSLITKPAQDVLNYDPDAIKAILKWSAGHPNFTQIICYEIFMQARSQERWNVESSDVENIIARAIQSAEGPLLSLLESLSSIHEQAVFSAAAKSQDPINTLLEQYKVSNTEINPLIEARNQLVKRGFLERVEIPTLNPSPDYNYKVKIELVRRWLFDKNKLQEVVSKLNESETQKDTPVPVVKPVVPSTGQQEQFDYAFSQEGSISPYCVGKPVPPNQFLGRKRELDDAFYHIEQCSNVVFYGSSGIGKTSFLKYLDEWGIQANNQYIIVYLDCNLINSFIKDFNFSYFWQEIFNKLNDLLNQSELNYQNSNKLAFDTDLLQSEINILLQKDSVDKNDVKQILRQIKNHSNKLVLLLDNYDAIFKQNNDNDEILLFLKSFVSLTQNEVSGCVATIKTSSNSLTELPQYENIGDYLSGFSILSDFPIAFQTFQDTEIRSLWNKMPDLCKEKITLENLKKFTGGYPALIQSFCYILDKEFKQKQIASNETLKNLERDFHVSTKVVFNNIWRNLNDIEKMLFRLIALYHVEGKINTRDYYVSDIEDLLTDPKYKTKLAEMQMHGIILSDSIENKNRKQNKQVYYFAASAMQEWVIREIASNSKAEVAERERIFLTMTKGQVNNIKAAMELIGNNLETVQNLTGGISTIIKLFGFQ
jgi:Cdc6-like AAA superfamily ATPase